jgi:hypothetical protein
MQLAEGFGGGGGSYNAKWLRALKDLQLRGLVRVFRAPEGARCRGTLYQGTDLGMKALAAVERAGREQGSTGAATDAG